MEEEAIAAPPSPATPPPKRVRKSRAKPKAVVVEASEGPESVPPPAVAPKPRPPRAPKKKEKEKVNVNADDGKEEDGGGRGGTTEGDDAVAVAVAVAATATGEVTAAEGGGGGGGEAKEGKAKTKAKAKAKDKETENDRRKAEEVAAPPPANPGDVRGALVRLLVERGGLTELQARDLEVGVLNWSIARADERRVARSWNNPKFAALYASKARSVAANVIPSTYVENARLARRIVEGEFAPHEVATMTVDHVFPERWREAVEAKVRRDEYMLNAKPTAMTDQFLCGRCKKRECSYMELQTRSCDEPASIFVQCLSCGNRWRMG